MSDRELIILGCSSQQPTRKRNHGAYFLRWMGEGLLFDPGEGTQRQFIFASIAPPSITRIFISHFHGDHCLGLSSILMRLNLDKPSHPIHCYYPAMGKVYFDRLRYGTCYHENLTIIEHPISKDGVVHQDKNFLVEGFFLKHGIVNVGYRITEPEMIKFDKGKIKQLGIEGPMMQDLLKNKSIVHDGKEIFLQDVSWIRKGDSFAIILDTLLCPNAVHIAKNVKLLLCESTYSSRESALAKKHKHLTASEAALIAKWAGVETLILTHFSARYPDVRILEKEAREIFPNTFLAEDFRKFSLRRDARCEVVRLGK